MRVKEWKGTVVFLHEVAEGSAGRSWGVHVAELAGVPATVVRRAAALMAAMEKQGGPLAASASLRALPLFAASPSENEPEAEECTGTSPLVRTLHDMNPDTMTPKQALDALYHLKSLAPPCADDPA